MTEVSTKVIQKDKTYILTFETTNYEFYKIMRQLGYLMTEQDKHGIMKNKKGE